jgi:hypothetical protein
MNKKEVEKKYYWAQYNSSINENYPPYSDKYTFFAYIIDNGKRYLKVIVNKGTETAFVYKDVNRKEEDSDIPSNYPDWQEIKSFRFKEVLVGLDTDEKSKSGFTFSRNSLVFLLEDKSNVYLYKYLVIENSYMYTFNFPEKITNFISKVDDFGNTYPMAKSPNYILKLHGNPSYFFEGNRDGKNMQLSNMEYIYSFTFEPRKYELSKEELSKKCG